jgi:glyoxylase-like metal-dependent hydrolase (beta-lactamase superfamily II)
MTRAMADPERSLERRVEVARQSGVPVEPLRRWAAERRESNPGIAAAIEPHRELVPGVEVDTVHGPWSVHYTPGHAPSHVVLFNAEQRLLLSGDHLLGRVSLYFDYGWTPDPVAEFLESLDTAQALGARLCLPGHGRPFGDVGARIDANRSEINSRLDEIERTLADTELTAYEVIPVVFPEFDPSMMGWALTIMLCFLTHLEQQGRAERVRMPDGQQPERWRARAGAAATP